MSRAKKRSSSEGGNKSKNKNKNKNKKTNKRSASKDPKDLSTKKKTPASPDEPPQVSVVPRPKKTRDRVGRLRRWFDGCLFGCDACAFAAHSAYQLRTHVLQEHGMRGEAFRMEDYIKRYSN